jgi:SAM-dependent MidA family methyltransferase
MQTTLPRPDADAIAHSLALSEKIHQAIESNDGWISFADFMHQALYEPGLGYYSGGAKKFGLSGDFVTAPEISPLFAKTLANQLAQVLQALKDEGVRADILELGAGTGRLAKDLLSALQQTNRPFQHYFILEVSAYLRDVQKTTLQAELPTELFEKVIWLDTLPQDFVGVILGNEVLDALPVHIVKQSLTGIMEVGVTSADSQFVWQEKPLLDQNLVPFVEQLKLADGYTTEACPAASGLIASLAQSLKKGVLLMIDYGFSRAEYYHPQRRQGTLMCHYRHYSHDNPLLYLGLQDITVHVDFTRIAEAAVDHSLVLEGFTTQAQFLINAGIMQLLEESNQEASQANYLPIVAAVQKLLSPAEMGDLFKVIGFKKNLNAHLMGFSRGDKTHTL